MYQTGNPSLTTGVPDYAQTVRAQTLTAAVGAEIAATRKEQGLSQTQLADLAGKKRVSVQRWETGGSLKLEDLADLARALGDDPAALFARAAARVQRQE